MVDMNALLFKHKINNDYCYLYYNLIEKNVNPFLKKFDCRAAFIRKLKARWNSIDRPFVT